MVIRPVFDEVCEDTFREAEAAIKMLVDKRREVADFPRGLAVREKVEKFLREHPNFNVYHADHGTKDAVFGHDKKPVIDLNNVHLMKGRIFYNNNCSSGKYLGVEAYRKGCKVFWGYSDVFIYVTDNETLKYFNEVVNLGLKYYLDGKSWEDAYKLTKRRMNEIIDELLKMGKPLSAMCMRHDRDVLVCYTEKNPPKDLVKRPILTRLKIIFRKILMKIRKVKYRMSSR